MRLIALALTAFAMVGGSARGATVALLENYHQGRLMQLEPGGRFSHVAIKVGSRWLHAHAAVGVELTDDIERFGRNVEIFENPHVGDPAPERVEQYLKMKYHPRLEWNEDDGTTYSARLVGELLGIAPRPALFRAEIWRPFEPGSMIGLSPDDIYQAIVTDLGFRLKSCDGHLVH